MEDLKQSRREFLKAAAGLAGAAATLGSSALSYSRIPGANERVRVGVVGFADHSRNCLLPAFQHLAGELNFELAALSDIWSLRREEGAAFLRGLTGRDVARARNNDELYDRKDIDAVIIATADFQHALHGIEAVRAGCHAYIETPLAETLEDAKAIRRAVEETGKVVQIGTQRRSGAKDRIAAGLSGPGRLGGLRTVELVWNVSQPGGGRRPDLVGKLRQEDTDWKRFLLNRPEEPWNPHKYAEYRLYSGFSSGIAGQRMVHQLDTIHWLTGLDHPRSVVAGGGIHQWPDGRTNPDTLTAVLDYGPQDDPSKGFQVVFTSRMRDAAGGTREVRSREIWHTRGGSINLETELFPEMATAARKRGAEAALPSGVDAMTLAHLRNWMECIRTGAEPNAGVKAGYGHSVTLCMVREALKTGRRVRFDAERGEIVAG